MALPGGKMGAHRPIKKITEDIKKLTEELEAAINAQQPEETQGEKKDEKKDEN